MSHIRRIVEVEIPRNRHLRRLRNLTERLLPTRDLIRVVVLLGGGEILLRIYCLLLGNSLAS